jgi:cell division protein FtsL
VVRAADPAARRVRSRSVATAFVAAMLVIAGLVPAAYNTMAGFTLETLRSQQAKLKQEQSTLDLQEAELLSPTHLEQIAKTLKMVDPSPDAIQYLDGKSKTADAQNRMPVAGDVQAR